MERERNIRRLVLAWAPCQPHLPCQTFTEACRGLADGSLEGGARRAGVLVGVTKEGFLEEWPEVAAAESKGPGREVARS